MNEYLYFVERKLRYWQSVCYFERDPQWKQVAAQNAWLAAQQFEKLLTAIGCPID